MTSTESIAVLDLHIVAVDFSIAQFHPLFFYFFWFNKSNQITELIPATTKKLVREKNN